MTIKIRSELVEAAKDYKYLIDRGYPTKESLDLVVKRYFLSNIERMIPVSYTHLTLPTKRIV